MSRTGQGGGSSQPAGQRPWRLCSCGYAYVTTCTQAHHAPAASAAARQAAPRLCAAAPARPSGVGERGHAGGGPCSGSAGRRLLLPVKQLTAAAFVSVPLRSRCCADARLIGCKCILPVGRHTGGGGPGRRSVAGINGQYERLLNLWAQLLHCRVPRGGAPPCIDEAAMRTPLCRSKGSTGLITRSHQLL